MSETDVMHIKACERCGAIVALTTRGGNGVDNEQAHLGWHETQDEDAEPEDEPAPAHLHHWTILRAQPHTPFVVIGKPVPHTIVLVRCTECGEPDSLVLAGEWTLEDLRAPEAEPLPGKERQRS